MPGDGGGGGDGGGDEVGAPAPALAGRLTVVGGPQCGNSGAWWQVSYNGVTGWTMEGQSSSYWTEAVNVGEVSTPVAR